jgi:hypothetical protein
MSQKSIRVVIRQPLHGLVIEWSKKLGIDDLGEVVNFLLLDLQRSGHKPTTVNDVVPVTTGQLSYNSPEIDDLAGLF